MHSRVCFLACAAVLLGAGAAGAQPLFRCEYDWTVEVGGRRFGVWDVVQTPGEIRWPLIWVANRKIDPKHHADDRWVLALPPVTAVLTVRQLVFQWEHGRR